MEDAAPRLAAGILVAALIRRAQADGGHGTVLARGDATAGAIVVVLSDRGVAGRLLERRLGPAGDSWDETGPADAAGQADYLARRRRADPDLWAVEIDHPRARAILAEVAG